MSNYLSYKQFLKHTETIANLVEEEFIPDEIIGVRHGGLYLSEKMAKYFNKPHKEIHVSFYDDKEKSKIPRIVEMIRLDMGKKYLICDDLVDSGVTLQYIKSWYLGNNIKTAVLLQNKKSSFKADYFADYYNGKWITFAWEK